MAEQLDAVLPIDSFTENEWGGDPGPRTGTKYLVPSGVITGPGAGSFSPPTVDRARALANYGDDIVIDRTAAQTLKITGWGDYAAKTINTSTPRQVTRSQLLRISPTAGDEEVVKLQAVSDQAVSDQAIVPQGPPSYIRIMGDAPGGTINGAPCAAVLPGTRVTKTHRTLLATVINSSGGHFTQAGGEFGGVSDAPNSSYRYWWFEGLRFKNAPGTVPYAAFYFWAIGTPAWQSYRQLPQKWMVHRCLWDSDVEGLGQDSAFQRAVVWEGMDFGVVDCGAYNMYGNTGAGDPGTFQMPYGGNVSLRNTYVESASSLYFCGGTGFGMNGRNSEHITIRRVHYRKPRLWQRSEVPSGTSVVGWNVTVAANKRSVHRNASTWPFGGFNDGRTARLGSYFIMYEPSTGLAAQCNLEAGFTQLSNDDLGLNEDWPGVTGSPITVYFQCASTVYNSGRPGDGATATCSSSSPTVTFSAPLPASVVPGQFFYLNDTGYVGTTSNGFAPCGNSFFRRKILSIAGNRLSCTLDGNWSATKTYTYSIVWWDGIDRSTQTIKSNHEHKTGKRILIEDTIYENNYMGAWAGAGLTLHPTSQDGATQWASDADITVRWVTMRRLSDMGSFMAYTPNVNKCFGTGRYSLRHILVDDLKNPDIDVPHSANDTFAYHIRSFPGGNGGAASDEQASGPITIEHVTIVNDHRVSGRTLHMGEVPPSVPVRNNRWRDLVIHMAQTNAAASSVFGAPLSWLTSPDLRQWVLFGPLAPSKVAALQGGGEFLEAAGVADAAHAGLTGLASGDYSLHDIFSTGTVTLTGAPVVFRESFNRANTSSVQLGPDLPWNTSQFGTSGIFTDGASECDSFLSNQIGLARCEATLPGADMYAQIKAKVFTSPGFQTQRLGPAVRYAAGATDTCYYAAWLHDGTNKTCQIVKRVAGVDSVLSSVPDAGVTSGDVLRLEASGAGPVSLTAKRNGATIATFSDSASPITGNVRAGFTLNRGAPSPPSSSRGSEFEFGELTPSNASNSVVLESGAWPASVAVGQPIKIGAGTTFGRIKSIAGDTITLFDNYALAPASGLTFVVTFKGTATDGGDPGCDVVTLAARQVGVIQEFTV